MIRIEVGQRPDEGQPQTRCQLKLQLRLGGRLLTWGWAIANRAPDVEQVGKRQRALNEGLAHDQLLGGHPNPHRILAGRPPRCEGQETREQRAEHGRRRGRDVKSQSPMAAGRGMLFSLRSGWSAWCRRKKTRSGSRPDGARE